MTKRKIITKITTGSHLYGTNRPDSDEDFQGVFLPSREDLLGLDNYPNEYQENHKKTEGQKNSAGDVDCKFFSLRRFFTLAGQGQPGQLEMLFAPPSAYHQNTSEWSVILDSKDLFLSTTSVTPFIGFALSQAHKAQIKGQNLQKITDLIDNLSGLSKEDQHEPIKNLISQKDGIFSLNGIIIDVETNEHGFAMINLAGRRTDVGLKTKTFINNLKDLASKYGTRSKAASENANGLDYKSLMHAYRLIGEAKELLSSGLITLPRPPGEVSFLLGVRNGVLPCPADGVFDHLMEEIETIKNEYENKSDLPLVPQWSNIKELCVMMQTYHLRA
jgi:hypothetical protein